MFTDWRSLAIGSLIAAIIFGVINWQVAITEATNANINEGGYYEASSDAVVRYIRTQRPTIVAALNANGGNPTSIPWTQIGAAVDPTIAGTNSRNHPICVAFRQFGPNNTIQSIVGTVSNPPLNDLELEEIATHGAKGRTGAVTSLAPLALTINKGRSQALSDYAGSGCAFGQGTIASIVTEGDTESSQVWLSRTAIPGQPQLNQMQTALDFAGQDALNIRNGTGTGNWDFQGYVRSFNADGQSTEVRLGAAYNRPGVFIGGPGAFLATAGLSFSGRGNNTDLSIDAAGNITAFTPLSGQSASFSGNVQGNILIAGSSATAPIYYTSSDARLKSNIAPISNPDRVLSALRPVTYRLKATGEPSAGLIAQDVERILPDAVMRQPDGTLAINYQVITTYLIAEVQALKRGQSPTKPPIDANGD